MKKRLILFLFIFIFSAGIVSAHPGKTDMSGCHTCKTNCEEWNLNVNEYHCHGGIAAKDTPAPTKKVVKKQIKKSTKKFVPTKKVVKATVAPTAKPVVQSSGYSCNCAKTCGAMSCEEAYFQLACGCSARDGDSDGVPCEAQCR